MFTLKLVIYTVGLLTYILHRLIFILEFVVVCVYEKWNTPKRIQLKMSKIWTHSINKWQKFAILGDFTGVAVNAVDSSLIIISRTLVR